MPRDLWPLTVYAGMAGVLAAMIFHRALVAVVLALWGRSARGTVLSCVEHNDDGVVYLVTYEFPHPLPAGTAAKRVAKQSTRYALRPKDIIAVRYLPAWPRVSRFVERVA